MSTHDTAFPNKASPSTTKQKSRNPWLYGFLLFVFIPISVAVILYQIDSFDPAPLPLQELTQKPISAPKRNSRMLHGSEKLGVSQLLGPEDLVYDPESQAIITGCADGWVKRVKIDDSTSELVINDLFYTGGRPLGLALGREGNIIVADADKGLLNLTVDGKVELLTDEADGLKFKLTDAVDIAKDGMIYFTDASSKYNLSYYIWDALEGRPNGRLLSYDPLTKVTKVLLSNLYFANGVAIAPDQTHVVFCETIMLRCRKYYIEGKKKGTVEHFVQLPGLPDNIHYLGDGQYWIALASGTSKSWEMFVYPIVRKFCAMLERIGRQPQFVKNGGLIVVDMEGNPVFHYHDVAYSMPSTAIKVGDYLYFGSVLHPYLLRLNMTQYPAHAVV